MRFRPWTADEDRFVRENYLKLTCGEIGKALGRTRFSIRARLKTEQLVRPASVRQTLQAKSYFAKSFQPWNKGLKGYHPGRETEFVPGHTPANTAYDGCIRMRIHGRTGIPYKYIRVARMKWLLLNRYVWEKIHGPIPPHHVIGFLDGNTLNCAPANLYMISRADLARRNHNIEKATISIRRAWEQGKQFTDKYVAWTIAGRDAALRATLINMTELLALKREQLKLRRQIHAAKKS